MATVPPAQGDMPELTPYQMWLLGYVRAEDLKDGQLFAIQLARTQGHIDEREVADKRVFVLSEFAAELDRLGRLYLEPRR